MFKKNRTERTELETAISDLFADMETVEKDSPEYARYVEQLIKLYPLQETDSKVKTGNRISKETLLTVGANLAGILLIVNYEHAHVLASKAISFIRPLR